MSEGKQMNLSEFIAMMPMNAVPLNRKQVETVLSMCNRLLTDQTLIVTNRPEIVHVEALFKKALAQLEHQERTFRGFCMEMNITHLTINA